MTSQDSETRPTAEGDETDGAPTAGERGSGAQAGDPARLDAEAIRALGAPIPTPQLGSVDREGLDSLGRVLLASESMAAVLHRAASFAQRSLPDAADVSVTLTDGQRAATAAWTGLLAFELDECQYGLGFGPCLDAAETGRPMLITDTRTDVRWPDFSAMAVRQGALSNLSVPIPLQRGRSRAALNIYALTPDAFPDELAVAGASHVAEQVATAIVNKYDYDAAQREVETLQVALDSRAAIEQAKGVLMAIHGYGPVEAFTHLSTQSQNTNTKLRDVAAAVVAQVRRDDAGDRPAS